MRLKVIAESAGGERSGGRAKKRACVTDRPAPAELLSCRRSARASSPSCSCFLSSLASATSLPSPFSSRDTRGTSPPLSPRWFLGHARVVCVLAPPRECAGVCKEIDLFSSLRVRADGSRKHEQWSRNEDSARESAREPWLPRPLPFQLAPAPSNMLCAGRTPDGEGGEVGPR